MCKWRQRSLSALLKSDAYTIRYFSAATNLSAAKVFRDTRLSLSGVIEKAANLTEISPSLSYVGPHKDGDILESAFSEPEIKGQSPSTFVSQDVREVVDSLKRLLSLNDSNGGRSVKELISLYDEAAKQFLLPLLDDTHFTEILKLLGSLALSSSESSSSVYGSPVASLFKMSGEDTIELISFISKVGEDKKRLGLEMNVTDHYWVMHAWIARTNCQALQNDDWDHALSCARLQYEQLRHSSDDPEVHLSYFNFLLSTHDLRYIEEAVRRLCELLDVIPDPHRHFPKFLWRTISLHGVNFSPGLKETICQTMFAQFARRTNVKLSPLDVFSVPLATVPKGKLQLHHLTVALCATVFPCYTSDYPKPLLAIWARELSRRALSPDLAPELRWSNVLFLGISMAMMERMPYIHFPSNTASLDPKSDLWRMTHFLNILSHRFSDARTIFDKNIQNIIGEIWEIFASSERTRQPVDISRVYIVAFFKLASKSRDIRLTQKCFQLSKEIGLWQSETSKEETMDVVLAYASAYISCSGQNWEGIYSSISSFLPGIIWQADITNAILLHYASSNVDVAFGLYDSCRQKIPISSKTLRCICLSLIANERWDKITVILENIDISRSITELIVNTSLQVHLEQGYEYADPAFVKTLASAVSDLYSHEALPISLKYPLQHFCSIMIRADNLPALLVLFVKILPLAPNIFTYHSIRRLILQICCRREFPTASRLIRIFEKYGNIKPDLLDMMRQLVDSRRETANSRMPMEIQRLSQIRLDMNNMDSIRRAISSMVKAKRLNAARNLYSNIYSTLDVESCTVLGNIIIHGPMYRYNLRNARLVRHVLMTIEVLRENFSFVPDRATVNIVTKAVLRWKDVNSLTVRNLFDEMIHDGYPVPTEWRRDHEVPFGSPQGQTTGLFRIPSDLGHISFTRHVRPLYKLFIKAFYLRGDIFAAKTLVGILKAVDLEEMRLREKRNRYYK